MHDRIRDLLLRELARGRPRRFQELNPAVLDYLIVMAVEGFAYQVERIYHQFVLDRRNPFSSSLSSSC